MSDLSGQHLILFFTFNVSLADWDRLGILSREIRIYQELVKSGMKVTFVTYGDDQDYGFADDLEGIDVFPLYAGKGKPKSKVAVLLKSIFPGSGLTGQLQRASIIKTNQMWGAWLAARVAKNLGMPLLVRCGYEYYDNACKAGTGFWGRLILKWLSKRLYLAATKVSVSTQEIKSYIIQTFGVDAEKISVSSNFVDTDLFSPKAAEELGNGRVAYVGRLSPEKNLRLVLGALSDTEIGIDVYGAGPEEQALRTLVGNNGIDCNFEGVVPNHVLAEKLRDYSGFVLCSSYEGHSKSLLEAMACGLAIVAGNIPAINAVIEDRQQGLLVELDRAAIRDGIETILSDASLSSKLGKEAREKVVAQYSLPTAVAREQELLGQLLTER